MPAVILLPQQWQKVQKRQDKSHPRSHMALGLAVLPAIFTTGHSLPAQPIHLK